MSYPRRDRKSPVAYYCRSREPPSRAGRKTSQLRSQSARCCPSPGHASRRPPILQRDGLGGQSTHPELLVGLRKSVSARSPAAPTHELHEPVLPRHFRLKTQEPTSAADVGRTVADITTSESARDHRTDVRDCRCLGQCLGYV